MKGEDTFLTCWRNGLQELQFTIIHRPGKLQSDVDRLSHLPFTEFVATFATYQDPKNH